MTNTVPHFELAHASLATGINMAYVDMGPRDAPVMLFLHGFPESHWTWRHQLRVFAQTHRVIAPDLRGYGETDKPQAVDDYAIGTLVDDVFALAAALDVSVATVVGHDWGGALAWSVAYASMMRPALRVERLIILNAPHPQIFQRLLIDNPEQRAASQYMRGFRDSANDALVREKGLVALLAQEVRWSASPAMTDQDRGVHMTNWTRAGAPFAMLNWYRASTIYVPALDEEVATRPPLADAVMPPLMMPVLVIWASDDLALPVCNLDGMERIGPDVTIHRVPGVGHFVPWEAPEQVNDLIRAWMR